MTEARWSTLGSPPPNVLHVVRLELHYAAQPLAAAAYAVLPMRADHSHSNLLWSASREGFVGRSLPGGQRMFLDPTGLRTGLLDDGGVEAAALELEGRTVKQALVEFADLLRGVGVAVPAAGLALPEYDLPDAPAARGEAFALDPQPLAELARWYGNAHGALAPVAEEWLGGAEVRAWPHHFDLAALVSLDPDRDPESARSVGAGFSPGDGSYPDPYFYVSPWPAPMPSALPELGSGAHWHTSGFTSAVLPASAIVAAGDARTQARLVRDFLTHAVGASLALLGD